MTQHVRDLLERDARAKHARRCGVAQHVGAGQVRVETCALIGAAHVTAHARGTERLTLGRSMVNENHTATSCSGRPC
jgi:hypothetical protein